MLPDNHWHTQLSPDETMIWFFARDGEELRVETRYDSDAAEYLLVVCWPDGDQHERFVDVSEFRSRLVQIEQRLGNERWACTRSPIVIPDGLPRR